MAYKKEAKATFTYATIPSVQKKAKAKAFKEGKTLSEKIDAFLRKYVQANGKKKKILIPTDFEATTAEAVNG